MQEIEYISCIYHKSYFSVPKEVRLNSTHYLIINIHNKRELKILLLVIQQTLIIKIL